MPKKPKVAAAPKKPAIQVREFFGQPHVSGLTTPSAVNCVTIHRFKVTIEPIDEPKEVLIERLRKLWRETPHNGHLTSGFDHHAEVLGITLDRDERGTKARER